MDDASLLIIFFGWIGFSVLAGAAASARGRSGIGWFFAGLLISPLFALLLVLVLHDNSEAAAVRTGENKACPRCAETIRTAAKMCRFCGFEIPETPQSQAMRETSSITM